MTILEKNMSIGHVMVPIVTILALRQQLGSESIGHDFQRRRRRRRRKIQQAIWGGEKVLKSHMIWTTTCQ